MKIEVDTKHDSREELAALAEMLQRLSRSSASGTFVPKPSRNIFDDPSPGVGLMNMFGDSSSSPQQAQQAASYSQPAPATEPSAAGGLFSIFGDSTAQVAQQDSSYSQPSQQLLSDPDKKTTAKDILDDERIQLY
jgi:hypothetical protein